jgi:3-hydroxybutyryl-CoA dehydrogenase
MGAGIAESFATAGAEVRLYDVDPLALERGRERIAASTGRAEERGRLAAGVGARALGRVELGTELEASVAGAGLVVEAAPERIELKLDLFERLDRAADPAAILASNTSALSPTRLAAATSRPDRVLGLHFFNPVPRMGLVEVVRGDRSSEETVARAVRAVRAIAKEPVVVADLPGFATTRLSALAGNEAFYMWMDGVAEAAEIDRAVRLGANHPVGPLELADMVGLDVRLAILDHLHQAWGEKFRPCPLLRRLVAAGRLGRKTGHGVYRYDADGRRLSA